MYPLCFKDFLKFKRLTINEPEQYSWKPFNRAWFNKTKVFYEEYIRFGGFPEVVLTKKISDKTALLRDIINSYIELDIKLLSDFSAGEDLYKLIKLLAARTGSKIDFSKLSSISGISRHKVTAYLQLLESTYFVYIVKPFTRNTDKEISQQPKLFFSDTGILNHLAGEQISSGQLFENAIAAQLYQTGKIQFYQTKHGKEIDFIYNSKAAIEVKETAVNQDLQVLKQRAAAIGLKKYFLISRHLNAGKFEEFYWGGTIF